MIVGTRFLRVYALGLHQDSLGLALSVAFCFGRGLESLSVVEMIGIEDTLMLEAIKYYILRRYEPTSPIPQALKP